MDSIAELLIEMIEKLKTLRCSRLEIDIDNFNNNQFINRIDFDLD